MTIRQKLSVLLLIGSLVGTDPLSADDAPAIRRYVVSFSASAATGEVGALAASLARQYGGRLEPYAAEGFSGFVIILSPERAQLLGADPRIASIQEQRDEFTAIVPDVVQPAARRTLRPVTNAGSTLDFGTYTYDLSGSIHRINGTVGADTFVYDVYGRIISGTHARPLPLTAVSQQYTYDRYGNIETIKTTGQPDRILAVDKNSNQLDSTTVTGANVNGTYDAAGNQKTLNREGIIGTFEYDGLNTVKESTIAGSRRVYIYSASDERLASFEGVTAAGATGKQQWTVRDARGQVLRRFIRANDSALLQWDEDYLYRETQMLAAYVNKPEKVLHFHPDHLGTPRLITGNGGAKVEENRYYAFGEELTPRIAGAEQKKFTGHERDSVENAPAADIDYMHARYYGVREGRFLAVDPGASDLRRPQTWNRYAYAEDNPMRNVDPDGMLSNPVTGEVGKGKPILHRGGNFGQIRELQPSVVASAGGEYGAARSGGRPHRGVDIIAPVGTPLVAAFSGRVLEIKQVGDKDSKGKPNKLGLTVVVAAKDGTIAMYAHMKSVDVEAGDRVKEGQTLGEAGRTGNVMKAQPAAEDHVHFQMQANSGKPINPQEFLNDPANQERYREKRDDH
jgi:RHS repeat-associated protein